MRWPWMRTVLIPLLLAALAAAVGCSSRQKKLSDPDGSVLDDLVYGAFGMDRDTTYYYELVKNSHDERFAYRPTSDKFIVDKNVNAVEKLGYAEYARLEGEAQVIALLTDVLLEDPSALAQANAATALTRLGLKLPAYRLAGPAERGDRFLAVLQELDRIHAPGGAARTNPAWARQRTVQILRQIGDFDVVSIALAKDTLTPFSTRDYLIDATDAAVRQAADTALVKRLGAVIRLGLRAALDNRVAFVREEAVRGLKTLGDVGARDAVLARWEVESNPRVRAEAVEYLGRLGTEDAVAVLLPALEDGDRTVAHKARQALTRIAGRDLGFRRASWTRWAHARFPELARRARAAEAKAQGAAGVEPSGDASGRAPAMP